MKSMKKLVNQRIYNLIMNIIILCSIFFILLEKFIELDLLSSYIMGIIDLVILGIFAADFLLRFAGDGLHYFAQDHGWIDFLAAVPLLSPAIKSFRFLMVFRTIRFLRVARVGKLVKSLYSNLNEIKIKIFLSISSSLILVLILAGGIILWVATEFLTQADLREETRIVEKAAAIADADSRLTYLLSEPRVEKVSMVRVEAPAGPFLRPSDSYTADFKGGTVIFTRKASRRVVDLFEGFVILGIFFITLAVLFVFSYQFDRHVIEKIKFANQSLYEKLHIKHHFQTKDDFEEFEQLIAQLK